MSPPGGYADPPWVAVVGPAVLRIRWGFLHLLTVGSCLFVGDVFVCLWSWGKAGEVSPPLLFFSMRMQVELLYFLTLDHPVLEFSSQVI